MAERECPVGARGAGLTGRRGLYISQEKEPRINGEINAPEIRLIGANGEQVGVVSLAVANRMAEEAELDLVEIAPTASPPVCRVMDYGKYKYREAKKRHEARLKQKQIVVKEIKFRPGTDEGDYKIKMRNLVRFLQEGDKAKVTLRYRGREMAHQELGFKLIERVRNELEPYSTVEQFPKMEGRQLIMVLAPKKGGKPVQKPAAKPAAKKSVAGAKSPAAKTAAEATAVVEKK